MKKVKFNASTSVHMVPDVQYKEYMKRAELRWKDFKSYKEMLLAGSEFEMVAVEQGQIMEVPNHYYERHKNTIVDQGVSFDNFVDDKGERIPFKQTEAVKHGYIRNVGSAMKKVKLFELVEENNNVH